MYMYMYVCVCVRARANVHTYVHTYIHTYMHIYIYIYICVCTFLTIDSCISSRSGLTLRPSSKSSGVYSGSATSRSKVHVCKSTPWDPTT